jgi:hypothetical protein
MPDAGIFSWPVWQGEVCEGGGRNPVLKEQSSWQRVGVLNKKMVLSEVTEIILLLMYCLEFRAKILIKRLDRYLNVKRLTVLGQILKQVQTQGKGKDTSISHSLNTVSQVIHK